MSRSSVNDQEATGKYLRRTWPTGQAPVHTTVTYSVRLTATNAGGSNTKTRTSYITVTR